MTDQHPSGAPWRNFYGRFKGKGLRDSQKRYLKDLTHLSPGAVDWAENPGRAMPKASPCITIAKVSAPNVGAKMIAK